MEHHYSNRRNRYRCCVGRVKTTSDSQKVLCRFFDWQATYLCRVSVTVRLSLIDTGWDWEDDHESTRRLAWPGWRSYCSSTMSGCAACSPVARRLQVVTWTDNHSFELIVLWRLALPSSKRGHGSPVSWASFMPIFNWLRPSILELGSATGQTNRQTDRQRPSMHYAASLWHKNVRCRHTQTHTLASDVTWRDAVRRADLDSQACLPGSITLRSVQSHCLLLLPAPPHPCLPASLSPSRVPRVCSIFGVAYRAAPHCRPIWVNPGKKLMLACVRRDA